MTSRPNYTILPANIRYAADIPSTAKILYSEILAFAGIGGKTKISNRYLAEAFHLSEAQVSSLINLLAEKGYISLQLFQNYDRQIKILNKKYKKKTLQEKLDPHQEKLDTPQEDWKLENELQKFENSNQRRLQIIALWIKLNHYAPQNKLQFKSIIDRNIKAAHKLSGYSNEDIQDTFHALKHTDYIKKITLETVGKYIDEIVTNKNMRRPRIIKWEEIKKSDGSIAMRPIYEKTSTI